MAVVNIKNPNRFINPNLLDNSYFVGGGSQQGGGQFPVNTRGQTSYGSTSVIYTIDRWKVTANQSVSIVSGGLTVNAGATIFQFLEKVPTGAPVTMSILTSSGELIYGTGTIPATGNVTFAYDASRFSLFFLSANKQFAVAVYNNAMTIAAVKAEIGSIQTLAHIENGAWVLNEIPQYGEERMRCFRAMADSADEYSYNPNAPIWSKTVSAVVNASGVISFPADVTIDNLIAIYEETQVTSPKSIIAIPYKNAAVSPASSAVRVYGIGNDGTLSLLSNGLSTFPKLTFVYRL